MSQTSSSTCICIATTLCSRRLRRRETVERVHQLGMPAVAMTDHGNIFGAVHFVNAAHKWRQAIVGCELYICKKDDHVITRTPPDGIRTTTCWCWPRTKKATQSGEDHVGGFATRVLLQASREQEVFGGTFEGLIGLSGCLKVKWRALDGGIRRGAAAAGFYSDLSAKKISFLRFRTRVWRWSTASIRAYSSWRRIWPALVATNDSITFAKTTRRAGCDAVHSDGKSIQETNRMKFEGNQFSSRTATRCCCVKDAPQ